MDTLKKSSRCQDVLNTFKNIEESSYEEFRNSTVVVTGANSGIGKSTAQYLAYYGATVVLACRSKAKAEAAIEEIIESDEGQEYCTKEEIRGRLLFIHLDLASLKSVAEFSAEIISRTDLPPLRCLILNAGLLNSGYDTENGFDVQFGVNHLGHFYLTKLLLEKLKQSSTPTNKSRVVVVTSMVHAGPYFTKEVTNKEKLLSKIIKPAVKVKGYPGFLQIYANTKLCNVYFAQKLFEREGSDLVVCSLHPGIVKTDIVRTGSAVTRAVMWGLAKISKSQNAGSSTTLTCVFAPQNEVNGKYLSDCKPAKVAKLASGETAEKARDMLWELSEELLHEAGFGEKSEI